jgi:hypothetical protein
VPTLLETVEQAAQSVRKAEGDLARQREALHAAMRQAYKEGIPITRIARAAGYSRQRTDAIVKR